MFASEESKELFDFIGENGRISEVAHVLILSNCIFLLTSLDLDAFREIKGNLTCC